jgi:hypothetical protein
LAVSIVIATVFYNANEVERARSTIFAAVDAHWHSARALGAPDELRPLVLFVRGGCGEDCSDAPLAETSCIEPNPVIEIDERAFEADLLDWTVTYAIPHEMAHVLVCIEEGGLTRPHGERWRSAVRRLAPGLAEKILHYQELQQERHQ